MRHNTDRAALEAENRRLKTLVQEGNATVAEATRLLKVRSELAELVGRTYTCRHCDNTKVNERTGQRCKYCKQCLYCRKNRLHRDLEMCNDCHARLGTPARGGDRR